MYEQPELPDWIIQLQNDVETYKAALLKIAQTKRDKGNCPYCSASMTELGGGYVSITPHDANCPIKLAEKALS